jgi:GNAT superfamily N-acetyltransferase
VQRLKAVHRSQCIVHRYYVAQCTLNSAQCRVRGAFKNRTQNPKPRTQELNLNPGTRNPKPQPQAGLTYRLMRDGEEGAVCELVHHVFDISVAPLYRKGGQRNFKKYADPEEMSARVRSDHFVLLALADGDVIGMIEMRHHQHLSLLFVEQQFQGKGVGGELLGIALEFCLRANPQLREVTVNSSPNALGAYERLGFASTGEEQVISGVRFVPMKKVLG